MRNSVTEFSLSCNGIYSRPDVMSSNYTKFIMTECDNSNLCNNIFCLCLSPYPVDQVVCLGEQFTTSLYLLSI